MSEVISKPPALDPVTPDELIESAVALRPVLRAQQQEAEARGTYSPQIHEAFREAGFYSILVPRRYGGLELDLTTYCRVMIEVSRGDPGTGWCLTLGSSHALVAGSFFPEEAQAEFFADGTFCAPHTGVGQGLRLDETEGGYIVNGRLDYASGVPYSRWVLGMAAIDRGPDSPPQPVNLAIRRNQVAVLDNWGGDRTLGMRASGSNSFTVEDVFVPSRFVVPGNWHEGFEPTAATPGVLLHGNPMYLGRAHATYHTSIASVQVGAAKAALDEFEEQMLGRKTVVQPFKPRYEDPHSQRIHGQAAALVDSAEAIVETLTARYHQYAERWASAGEPFDIGKAIKLYSMAQQAGAMAAEAVELMFRSAGTSASVPASRLARYFRDTAMYRGHQSSQRETYWARMSLVRLGLADGLRQDSGKDLKQAKEGNS
jgi:3-hydroxy-9,10-secoandrosta-1,3,5(10)-triene-9,17-dione monooxygenase